MCNMAYKNLWLCQFVVSRRTAPMDWPLEVMYPAYCNGWLYVVTPKIMEYILQAVPTSPFVFIDDIYITGILRYHRQ